MIQKHNEDITRAETLDKHFYLSEELFQASKEKLFWNSWHFVGIRSQLFNPEVNVHPITILDSFLDEAVLMVEGKDDSIECMSNVCTHRGFQLIHQPSKLSKIHCGYHGRRFDLEGNFEFMPEFKQAEGFPRPCDHLGKYKIANWRDFLFIANSPAFEWSSIETIMNERVGFLNLEQFRFSKTYSKEYMVHAHWALYVDNYLEGFHIPFVHSSLNDILDYGAYETKLYDHCNLQIAYSSSDAEFCFDLPKEHVDYGKKVTAYYYWVFPNMMFNFYPWGVQINTVMPLGVNRSKVLFLNYIYDMDIWNKNNYGQLSEKVEREDEFVVESVQKGLKNKFYQSGRYSPKREKGVHQFHQLVAKYMNES